MPATHLDLIPGLAELQLAHWPDQSKYLQTIDKTNHTNIWAFMDYRWTLRFNLHHFVMYWLFGHRVSRVRLLTIWSGAYWYCDALMVGLELETFCCCVFVVDVTKETAAWWEGWSEQRRIAVRLSHYSGKTEVRQQPQLLELSWHLAFWRRGPHTTQHRRHHQPCHCRGLALDTGATRPHHTVYVLSFGMMLFRSFCSVLCILILTHAILFVTLNKN